MDMRARSMRSLLQSQCQRSSLSSSASGMYRSGMPENMSLRSFLTGSSGPGSMASFARRLSESIKKSLSSSALSASSSAPGRTWMIMPAADATAPSSMRTPRATLEGCCSEVIKYCVKSSAISPLTRSILPT